MSNRQKAIPSPVHQMRSAANSEEGSKAQKSFTSVSPVQRAASGDMEETASLKADPAQLNELEEEVK